MRVIVIVPGYLDTAGMMNLPDPVVSDGFGNPPPVYEQVAEALAQGRPGLARRLIIRWVAPEEWPAVLEKCPENIKVVVDMTASPRKERVK